jgi:mannose-6-phosphate isomerase-like protein (cupin superfamily)
MSRRKPFLVKVRGVGRFQRLLDPPAGSVYLKSGSVVLAPGEAVGAHITAGKEEFIIVLEGKVKIVFEGGQPIRCSRLSCVYVPPQTVHNVLNCGVTRLHYIYVVCPVPAKAGKPK